jgi:hypothetical protein
LDNAPDEDPLVDAALAIREPLAAPDHMEERRVATAQSTVHLLQTLWSRRRPVL